MRAQLSALTDVFRKIWPGTDITGESEAYDFDADELQLQELYAQDVAELAPHDLDDPYFAREMQPRIGELGSDRVPIQPAS